jgi:chromatin assembly factor 1 subunit A
MHLLNEQPSANPYPLLSTLSRKHLQFAEDVRPAYNGTFTRFTKLTPRNPFKKDIEAFAYDYDSEAEWEFEPEDGENLDDESVADDEEGSMMGDSGDEEDRAFLDDEDDVDAAKYKNKAKGGKRVIAPLIPIIKGVCWEVNGVQQDEMLSAMKARILLFDDKGHGIKGSINPFSGEYWVTEMPPPPPPILDAQLQLKKADHTGGVELVRASAKAKTPFPDAHLKDFLKAIQGSTDNQILLVELLKKR